MLLLPPMKFYLIADYKPNESIVVLMEHHAICDGVQGIAILNALTTKKDFSRLPKVTPPTFV